MRIIIKSILLFLVLVFFRVKKIGEENIPKEGAVLICPNHIHFLDPVSVVVTAKRKINVLAKEELWKNPILRYLAEVFGGHPVKRDGTGIAAIKAALKVLKSEEPLLMYPEGTRNGIAKGLKPKEGAVTLAIKSGAPIIPIGIQGNFKLFRKVKLNIGKPIYYTKETIGEKTTEQLTKELMDEIIKLRDEECKTKHR